MLPQLAQLHVLSTKAPEQQKEWLAAAGARKDHGGIRITVAASGAAGGSSAEQVGVLMAKGGAS